MQTQKLAWGETTRDTNSLRKGEPHRSLLRKAGKGGSDKKETLSRRDWRARNPGGSLPAGGAKRANIRTKGRTKPPCIAPRIPAWDKRGNGSTIRQKEDWLTNPPEKKWCYTKRRASEKKTRRARRGKEGHFYAESRDTEGVKPAIPGGGGSDGGGLRKKINPHSSHPYR